MRRNKPHKQQENPVMSRRTMGKRLARTNTPWSPEELRELLDTYLSSGKESFARTLAQKFQRTEHSLEMILFHRFPKNYTEGGQRQSLVKKVSSVLSSLDFDRVLRWKDTYYVKRLNAEGMLSVMNISTLVHIPTVKVERILREKQ